MDVVLPSKANATQTQTYRLTASRLLRLYVLEKASEWTETALPAYYLLIILLLLTKSKENPSNNLMMGRAGLSMNGGFHKKKLGFELIYPTTFWREKKVSFKTSPNDAS